MVARVARQVLAHVLERPPGQDRDAVAPARLAARRDIVAAVLERLGGKLLGRDLGLLEQRDVGARLIQPVERDRQAGPDRVDVPGGDLHGAGGGPQTAKELPHPQDAVAFGLLTRKYEPVRSST